MSRDKVWTPEMEGLSNAEIVALLKERGVTPRGTIAATQGLRVDRWLYSEPYFSVVYVSDRPSALAELRRVRFFRGVRDIRGLVEAASEGQTGLCCIELKLSEGHFQSCPKSIEYWIEDLVAEYSRVERMWRGGANAVTFVHRVLSDRLPFVVVALSVGKRCQAAEIVPDDPWWTWPLASQAAVKPKKSSPRRAK